MAEAARCFSCGTCNACDNCYLVCPEPCIVRLDRSNGLYKILVDYCKGCRVCIEECPTGCLEGVPELDFDTGVIRMDTAFAITQGLHGRQAAELMNVPQKTKDIAVAVRLLECGHEHDRSDEEENGPDQRLRRVGAGGEVRRRRRDRGVSDPSVYRDDDGVGADGGQRRARRRIHRRRQRALAVEHRARRVVERRARLHRQLRRRRALRLRAVFADLGQPDAGADDDRRPNARSAGRFRLGAHRRAVDARHGLADGMVVRRAGSVRQSPDGLSHRRGPARAVAADGVPGRLLRLAHHDRCRAARRRAR